MRAMFDDLVIPVGFQALRVEKLQRRGDGDGEPVDDGQLLALANP